MKFFATILVAVSTSMTVTAQITTPVIKANFGVDADLRSNFFNGFVQNGNDDWFALPGSVGTGQGVIDTAGAAAIVAQYATDANFRKLPFYRTMRYPAYSVVNNRMLIDAVFIRDYHGDDSTNFFTGNKNSMSPADWNCPVSQQLPDKNDILDMFVHVRRAGPNATDSLWLFGGLSIENTTGSRYFDFEMYQTDIYYDRATRRFYNYGPNEGHTAWEFDAAGNVTKPGDIIFTAEFGSSSLTSVEARIWVSETVYTTVTPANFAWAGQFDKATNSSLYGYASIRPQVAAAFYTGIQCGNNTWAGPFSVIRENNTVQTVYSARQFMEMSVNLTRLGLDPVNLLGGNLCGMPFRRILAKTRASTAFTAELKDFVGPFDFFLPPKAQAVADVAIYCGVIGVSTISVVNPYSTSVYTWTTSDGNIVGSNTGSSIVVDMPGTYIVKQQLSAGCSDYASDTVTIVFDPLCEVLSKNLTALKGSMRNRLTHLEWTMLNNNEALSFETERSSDGKFFLPVSTIPAIQSTDGRAGYTLNDDVSSVPDSKQFFYRIKIHGVNGKISYSNIIRMADEPAKQQLKVYPNPASSVIYFQLYSNHADNAVLQLRNAAGLVVYSAKTKIAAGTNVLSVNVPPGCSNGVYYATVITSRISCAERVTLLK